MEGGKRYQAVLYSQASSPSVSQSLIGRSEVGYSTSSLVHMGNLCQHILRQTGDSEGIPNVLSVLCSSSERKQNRSRN